MLNRKEVLTLMKRIRNDFPANKLVEALEVNRMGDNFNLAICNKLTMNFNAYGDCYIVGYHDSKLIKFEPLLDEYSRLLFLDSLFGYIVDCFYENNHTMRYMVNERSHHIRTLFNLVLNKDEEINKVYKIFENYVFEI